MGRYLSFVLVVAAVAAQADPGAVTWSGGTLRLLDEHPSVSLVAEQIVLEPNASGTLVTVALSFHNAGPAATVPMAFPTLKLPGPGMHVIEGFTVEAGGAPLEVTVREDLEELALSERAWPCQWRLFEVPFGADADLAMVVRYHEARPHYAWGEISVPYVLATGASWQGAIRSVDVEVRLGERLAFSKLAIRDRPGGLYDPSSPGRLPLQEYGATLRWRTEHYDGAPEILWLSAQLGPAEITRDDGAPPPWATWQVACWHEGRTLLAHELLAECLLATVAERTDTSVTLEKEGRVVELPAVPVGGEAPTGALIFVDPAPALAEFGGAVGSATNDAGDLVVRIITCPDSAASARATALAGDQQLGYRLKALRTMARRWPEDVSPTCAELLAREQEEAMVLAWAVGWMAEAGTPVEQPSALVERIAGERSWHWALGEAILAATDGREFAGALAMVPPLVRATMRDILIAGISECADWQQAPARGMNAGIALRRLAAPDAADALMQAVRRHGGQQPSEDAMMGLGGLGDDRAVEFLQALAVDANAHTRDINCAAAQALTYIGTPAALRACVDTWLASEDREVQARAFRGLRIACGEDETIWHTYRLVLPAWEPARMDPAEGRRLCRELLAPVDAGALDERRQGDRTRLLGYIEAQRAGG